MNFLDIISGRASQTYTGARYYETMPIADVYAENTEYESAQNAGKLFDYEYIDVTSRRYAKVFGNVISTDATQTAIMTKSDINFVPNSYVALKDGNLYQIGEVGIDARNAPKEAARFLLSPVGTEKVLRLNRIADAWGIAGAR